MKSNNARPHSPRVPPSPSSDVTPSPLPTSGQRSRFFVGEERLKSQAIAKTGGWSSATPHHRTGSITPRSGSSVSVIRPPSTTPTTTTRDGGDLHTTPANHHHHHIPVPSRPASAKVVRPVSASRTPKWAMPQLVEDDTTEATLIYTAASQLQAQPHGKASTASLGNASSVSTSALVPAAFPIVTADGSTSQRTLLKQQRAVSSSSASNNNNNHHHHNNNNESTTSVSSSPLPSAGYELTHRPVSDRCEVDAVKEATKTGFHMFKEPVYPSDKQTLFSHIQQCFDHNVLHSTSLATACDEAMAVLKAAGAGGGVNAVLPSPNGVEASVAAMLLVRLSHIVPTGVGSTIRALLSTLLGATFIDLNNVPQSSKLLYGDGNSCVTDDCGFLVTLPTFAEELNSARTDRDIALRQRINIGNTLSRVNHQVDVICQRGNLSIKRLCFRAWKKHTQNREVSEGNWLMLRRISSERDAKRAYFLRWWATVCCEREARLGTNAEVVTDQLRENVRTHEQMLSASEAENSKLRRSKDSLESQIERLEGLLEDEREETLRARMRFREVEGELQEFKKYSREALRLLSKVSASLCSGGPMGLVQEVAQGLGGIGGAKPMGTPAAAFQHAIGSAPSFRSALSILKKQKMAPPGKLAAVPSKEGASPSINDSGSAGQLATTIAAATHHIPHYVSPSFGSLSHKGYIANVPAFVIYWANQSLSEARSHLVALESRILPAASAYYHLRKTSTMYPRAGWFGVGVGDSHDTNNNSILAGLPHGAQLGYRGMSESSGQSKADILALLEDLSDSDEEEEEESDSSVGSGESSSSEDDDGGYTKVEDAGSVLVANPSNSGPTLAAETAVTKRPSSARIVGWAEDTNQPTTSPSTTAGGDVPTKPAVSNTPLTKLRRASSAVIAGGRLMGSRQPTRRTDSVFGASTTSAPPSPTKKAIIQAVRALRRWRHHVLELTPATISCVADLAKGHVYLVLLWRIMGHTLGISDFYVPRLPPNTSSNKKGMKKATSSSSPTLQPAAASSPRRSVAASSLSLNVPQQHYPSPSSAASDVLVGTLSGATASSSLNTPFESDPDRCARILRMATYLGVDGGIEVSQLLSADPSALTPHFLFCARLMGHAINGQQNTPNSVPLGSKAASSASLLAAMTAVSSKGTTKKAQRRVREAYHASLGEGPSGNKPTPSAVESVLGHSRSFSIVSGQQSAGPASPSGPSVALYSRVDVSDERIYQQTHTSEHLRAALEGISSRLDTLEQWRDLSSMVGNYAHKVATVDSKQIHRFDPCDILQNPTGLTFVAECVSTVDGGGGSILDVERGNMSVGIGSSSMSIKSESPRSGKAPAQDALVFMRPRHAGGLQRANAAGPLPYLSVVPTRPFPLISPFYLQPSSSSPSSLGAKLSPIRLSVTPQFILHLLRTTAIMPAADCALVFSEQLPSSSSEATTGASSNNNSMHTTDEASLFAAASYFSNEINDIHTTNRYVLQASSLYYATCSTTETAIPDATLDSGAWVRLVNDIGLQFRSASGGVKASSEQKDAFIAALQERITTVFRWLCAAYGEDTSTGDGPTTPAALGGAKTRGAPSSGNGTQLRVPLSTPTSYLASCAVPIGILYLFFAFMQSLRVAWAGAASAKGASKDPSDRASLPFSCVEEMASMYRAFFDSHVVTRINTSYAAPLLGFASSPSALSVLKRHRRNMKKIFVEFGGGGKAANAANARLGMDQFVGPLSKDLKLVDAATAQQLFHTVRLGSGAASPNQVGIDFNGFQQGIVLMAFRADLNPVGSRSAAIEAFLANKLLPLYRTRLDLHPW